MAVTAFYYTAFFKNVIDRTQAFDIDTDTINLTLHTSTYVPTQYSDDDQADFTNELPTAGGYTVGGATISSPTAAKATNVVTIDDDGSDVAWTSATFTARYGVIADITPGVAANNPLMSFIDFGGDETVSSGTFTIQFNASGIGTVTPADYGS
jgi:hypothetical protein